jgi:2-octaprenyl-6-methoxyphenol hydroxylase
VKCDVAIIGGGLVGLVAARLMSAQGRSVRLIESRPLAVESPALLDVRSIALSLSSLKIMQAVGLEAGLHSQMTPISDIHISSAGHFGVTRLHARDLKLERMGAVVEYHVLMRHFLQSVESDPAIEIISPAQFVSLQQHPDRVILKLETQSELQELEAALVLVADGANSQVRDALQIQSQRHDYRQSAIIANVKVQDARAGWAFERFTSSGPLAMLPLSDRRYALVWTQRVSQADALIQAPDDEFIRQLQQLFGYRLGYITQVGRRDRFDLKLIQAQQLVTGRCVLIGNAANTLHPVAGQGFNLALRDVAYLYDLLNGLDPNGDACESALAGYQKQRASDQQQTIRLGHGLVELFSNSLPLLNHLRAGALAALDVCPLLKHEFCWNAMGYGAGSSSLMRGVM